MRVDSPVGESGISTNNILAWLFNGEGVYLNGCTLKSMLALSPRWNFISNSILILKVNSYHLVINIQTPRSYRTILGPRPSINPATSSMRTNRSLLKYHEFELKSIAMHYICCLVFPISQSGMMAEWSKAVDLSFPEPKETLLEQSA